MKTHIYRNLKKSTSTWSIRQNGKVVTHSDYALMKHVHFRVQKSGHARYLKSRQRNVFAYASGFLILDCDTSNRQIFKPSDTIVSLSSYQKAYFNAELGQFEEIETKEVITYAARAYFNKEGELYVYKRNQY